MPADSRGGRRPRSRSRGSRKAFGAVGAVDGAALRVDRGALVALLGPSGSGKSTLLRLIAGFERPDAGTRPHRRPRGGGPGHVGRAGAAPRRHGLPARRAVPPPHRRRQRRLRRVAAASARPSASSSSASPDRAGAYPHELSGGERQRVALARALAADPEVVLLDEPFAALDAGLRERLREEVAAILRAAGTSALLVTHDQAEALSLADTVAVLREGRVEQVGLARGGLRAARQPLGGRVPRRRRRAARHRRRRRGGVRARALRRRPRGSSGPVEVVVRPESVAVGLPALREPGAEAVVLERSFFGHDQLAAPRARRRRAAALAPARLPGLASRRPRARVARRAGQRAVAPPAQPRTGRAPRGRARRRRRRTAARRRASMPMCVSCGTVARSRRTSAAPPSGVPPQRPQRARAEVAVDVAAPDERGSAAAAVDEPAGHRAAVVVGVGRHGPHELAARGRASWPAMRCVPSNALQPRFLGGSSGSSRTRLTSSTSSWPTSPIHSSPSAGSKEKRHGLRRPMRTVRQRGGPSTGVAMTLPSRESRVLGRRARVERAAAVAEPEVEAAVRPEGELAAVVVLLGLVDGAAAARTGRARSVPSPRARNSATRVSPRAVAPVQVEAAVRGEVGVEGDAEQALLGAGRGPRR